MNYKLAIFFFFFLNVLCSQDFEYEIHLNEKQILDLPGIHSYVSAQFENKILIIGGRKDGIHPRQPFNSFPENKNNDTIFVFDTETKVVWKKSLDGLPISLVEQLQSTNMNFYQDKDTLIIVGGYAFSKTMNDHTTFPYLTSVKIPSLINHVQNNESILGDFQQIENEIFAITGGSLNKIEESFYLIGGHRFEGRYNPMNRPTFIQNYVNGVYQLKISSHPELKFELIKKTIDPIHLHRRDFNLLPQYFGKNQKKIMISAGAFQLTEDYPFLYPVEINSDTIIARTEFNQYLSNYHSAKALFYSEKNNSNFTLFFGGISQFYAYNHKLVQDKNVPFVRTISLLKNQNGMFEEFKLEAEMPKLKGAGAEFFPLMSIPRKEEIVLFLDELTGDSIKIGHIFGGIESLTINAFTDNDTELTKADQNLYEVYLIKSKKPLRKIEKEHKFKFSVNQAPTKNQLLIEFELDKKSEIYFYITNLKGEILDEGLLSNSKKGLNKNRLNIDEKILNQELILTISKDYLFFDTKRVILHH